MPKIIAKSYSSKKSNTTQYNAIQRNIKLLQNTILLYYCRLNGYSRKSRKQ